MFSLNWNKIFRIKSTRKERNLFYDKDCYWIKQIMGTFLHLPNDDRDVRKLRKAEKVSPSIAANIYSLGIFSGSGAYKIHR